MSDYISREKLAKKATHYEIAGFKTAKVVLLKDVMEVPAADVKPVARGKWKECDWVEYDGRDECIHYQKEGLCCSNCKRVFKKELLWVDSYCPSCGAIMREEQQE